MGPGTSISFTSNRVLRYCMSSYIVASKDIFISGIQASQIKKLNGIYPPRVTYQPFGLTADPIRHALKNPPSDLADKIVSSGLPEV